MRQFISSLLTTAFVVGILISINPCNLAAQGDFDAKNVTLYSQVTFPYILSDVWGYTDADNGNEYALVGTNRNFVVIDVTNPGQPVEIGQTEGGPSTWRDIKTWGKYAYGVDDAAGEGLIIIDLSAAPDSISWWPWAGNATNGLRQAHNIFIDENGIAYLFGSNLNNTLILDLNEDPTNPKVIGAYDDEYVHDGFVRGDTMWTSEIEVGQLVAVDVSDKMNPIRLGSINTPSNFTHNCWLSDDNKTCFTTDETGDAYIGVYDVSDVTNMQELDRIQSSPGENVIPHNAFVKGNYLYVSYYTDGLVVYDISNPRAIIEVGKYDSSNFFTGEGFSGAWGTYPYFESGTILISDIENGLFVVFSQEVPACHLQGQVTDVDAGTPVYDATVELVGGRTKQTGFVGEYITGVADAGFYTVTAKKVGYETAVIEEVLMGNGMTTDLNIQMKKLPRFDFKGSVINGKGDPVEGIPVILIGDGTQFETETDAGGAFIVPDFFAGEYNIYAGEWGYIVGSKENLDIPFEAAGDDYTLVVTRGYYDDFVLDYGWKSTGANSDAGGWVRVEPIGTNFGPFLGSPEEDVQGDFGDKCFVTGNGDFFNFVNDQSVKLTSPTMDLTNYSSANLSFFTWFVNISQNSPGDDNMKIEVNNGTETIEILELTISNTSNGQWDDWSFDLGGLIDFTEEMTVTFTASANAGQQLLECGVDFFQVTGEFEPVGINTVGLADQKIELFPNPFSDQLVIEIAPELFQNSEELSFKLLDINGKLLKNQVITTNNFKVTRDQLINGIYIYSIQNPKTGESLHTGKVVVE